MFSVRVRVPSELTSCHKRALEDGKNNSYSCNVLSFNSKGPSRRDVIVVIWSTIDQFR